MTLKRPMLLAAFLAAAMLSAATTPGEPQRDAYAPSARGVPVPEYELLCSDAVATIYHAVPAQCNADVTHTASMMTIDPARAGEYRILAMERTMMAQYGIAYGDTVLVRGTSHDGLWRVEDTMNRRFKGKHKIDFLVSTNLKTGYWNNVKIYRPVNRHRRGAAAAA